MGILGPGRVRPRADAPFFVPTKKGPRLRISTTRRALLASAAVLAALAPTPARAADAGTPVCQTLIESTPGATADLDGDGNPDYTVPSITDVTLCSDAAASYVVHQPTIGRCFVGWKPTCVAVYVRVMPAWAEAGARGELCYTIEGQGRSCAVLEIAPLIGEPPPQTVCIGIDVTGGRPCSSGDIVGFE